MLRGAAMLGGTDFLRQAAEAAQKRAEHVRQNGFDWQAALMCNAQGVALPNLANVAHALRHAPQLAGMFIYDEMQCHSVITRTVPQSNMTPVDTLRHVTDADVSAVQEWLQHAAMKRLGIAVTHQAVDQVAREAPFHPVRLYLSALEWDGTRRIDQWLAKYLGAARSRYATRIGRMFLIAMVARVMQPGCKADYMLILEGKRGSGKSNACSILGGDWFSDALPDLATAGKDVAIHLEGKWVIEIAELSALSKAESGLLKSFVSRTEEKYRPPYGRKDIKAPRQCVFIGTTNKSVYLKDATGGRRFWPVKTGRIKLNNLATDRDQLLAEALIAFKNGEKWWPDRGFENRYVFPEQAARRESDAWLEPIASFVANMQEVTIHMVAEKALSLRVDRIGKAEQNRIAEVLEELGWTRGKRTASKRPWFPPAGVTQ